MKKLMNLFSKIFKAKKMQVSKELKDFLEKEVLDGIDISPDFFWKTLENLIHVYGPINKELLNKRKVIQDKIDDWHLKNQTLDFDLSEYKSFLYEIGYIVPESETFSISTKNVDPEVSQIAGPQLVVPVMNARFALNAANAR